MSDGKCLPLPAVTPMSIKIANVGRLLHVLPVQIDLESRVLVAGKAIEGIGRIVVGQPLQAV